jgi:hypothetical protein
LFIRTEVTLGLLNHPDTVVTARRQFRVAFGGLLNPSSASVTVFLTIVNLFLIYGGTVYRDQSPLCKIRFGIFDVHLPRAVRLFGGGLGVVLTVSAVALFVFPEIMISSWPWTVSPLTARVLAGWFALFGVVVLDPRWSAARILVQSQVIGFTLVLLGVARVWHNFDPSSVLTWGVVGGMVLYLCAIAVLYLGMERR